MKKNIISIQTLSLIGSLLTIGGALITNIANEKLLDEKIEKKVAEMLSNK